MKNELKLPSNRSFGLVFFVVFFIIAIWPIFYGNDFRYWSLTLSIIFLVLGALNSKILKPLNILWMKFGLLLGKIISPIILGMIYYLVVTPISLLLKIFGKDILNLKRNNSKSYWIEKDNNENSMKNQF